jgi:hypothetical protein
MKFIETLLNNGYKAYHITDNMPAKNPYHYTSAQPMYKNKGCMRYHFYKDTEVGQKEKAICFGLNQRDKPPVLVYPRPRVAVVDSNGNGVTGTPYDDAMIICLDNVDNQLILDIITGIKKVGKDFLFKFEIDKHQQVKDITIWE